MISRQKILTVIQRLMGRALESVAAVWSAGVLLASDYAAFMQWLKEVFDHPDQGESSVADYAIQFCILAAGSG